jgi:hypothetical protein
MMAKTILTEPVMIFREPSSSAPLRMGILYGDVDVKGKGRGWQTHPGSIDTRPEETTEL